MQRQRLESRDAHPLTIERIEAAHRVAHHQKSAWEPREFFVAPSQIRGKRVRHGMRQRLGLADDVVDVRTREAVGETLLRPTAPA